MTPGPRTAGDLWRQAGISSLDELEAAATAGRLRDLRGMSVKTEQRLLEGLKSFRKRPPRRMRLGTAADIVGRLERLLGSADGVAPPSCRQGPFAAAARPWPTWTSWSNHAPDAAIDKLQRSALVDKSGENPGGNPRAAGGRAGANRATVQLVRGPQLDVMTMPVGQTGTYLVHFTGSAEHNVRLRQIARDQRLEPLGARLHAHRRDGEVIEGAGAERRTFATEEEVYAFLELPWIAPELREDRGEIEAARAGRLPDLVASRTCRATATRTRNGRMGRDQSRSGRRRRARVGTRTWC